MAHVEIVAVGLNHRTAPVEIRERLAVRPESLASFLPQLRVATHLDEVAVLSTCNRFELYGVLPQPNGTVASLVRFLSDTHGVPPELFSTRLYHHWAPESVGHLYRVASGLDSMVLGEQEVLGQVKTAYEAAHAVGTTGKFLNRLFETAINAAKAVRSQTTIGCGALSVGAVAVSLARKVYSGGLTGRSVMLWGAGQVAELTLTHLRGAGAASVIVSNRRAERAQALAVSHGAAWADLDTARAHLATADIVLVSTAAPRYLLDAETVRQAMRERRQRPLFLIDLAVPRNVDQAVGRLDNVYLYNIDDLESIAAANGAQRQAVLSQALAVVEYKVGCFMRWLGRESVATVGSVPEWGLTPSDSLR